MNKKDFEEIAGILKTAFMNTIYEADAEAINNILANKLADYFEREDQYLAIDKETDLLSKDKKVDRNKLIKFNRQQFLKDCGVKWKIYMKIFVYFVEVN